MQVLEGSGFASIFSEWTFSRILSNKLSHHGSRLKLIPFELGLQKQVFIFLSSLPSLSCTSALFGWQSLYSLPSMETVSSHCSSKFPSPQDLLYIRQGKEIYFLLEFLQLSFYVLHTTYSTLIESLFPTWFSMVLTDLWIPTVLCCNHVAEKNSMSVPRWTDSWKKLLQLLKIHGLDPKSHIFEESDSWTMRSM